MIPRWSMNKLFIVWWHPCNKQLVTQSPTSCDNVSQWAMHGIYIKVKQFQIHSDFQQLLAFICGPFSDKIVLSWTLTVIQNYTKSPRGWGKSFSEDFSPLYLHVHPSSVDWCTVVAVLVLTAAGWVLHSDILILVALVPLGVQPVWVIW